MTQPEVNQQQVERLLVIKEQNETSLLAKPNVVGVDVGFKYVGGERTSEIAIRVFVTKKEAVDADAAIPSNLNSAQTDVIEEEGVEPLVLRLTEAEAAEISLEQRFDPLQGGISTGPCRTIGGMIYVGTIGAIVEDTQNNYYGLSNWHVLGVNSEWKVGDDVAQPSRVDGGRCSRDTIGSITAGCLASTYSCNGQQVDAALASTDNRSVTFTILNLGEVEGSTAPQLGERVRKQGRTTDLTHGSIDGVGRTVNVDFGHDIGPVRFTNQISIVSDTQLNPRFSDSGDSGSVVVNDQMQIVGLLFAGSRDGIRSYANVFRDVELALGITPLTQYLWTLGRTINSVDRTPEPVTMSSFNGRLYAAWKQNSSGNQIFISSTANPLETWPVSQTINDTDATPKSLAMAAFNGSLYLAWKQNTGRNRIFISGTDNPLGTWPLGRMINDIDATPEAVAMAAFNGKLYLAWKQNSSGNRIFITGTNDPLGTWPQSRMINDIDATPQAVAMAAFNGKLYLAWKQNSSGNRIFITGTDDPLGTWPQSRMINDIDAAPQAVAMAAFNGELYLAWKQNNSPNRIYFTSTTNPLADWPVAKQSNTIDATSRPPALGVFNSTLYMMWKANSSSNQIYISAHTS
jgi:hypothetical protein